MKFVQYGNKDGRLVVYFHGAPGSIDECAIFESHAKKHQLNIICFDRFAIDSSLDREGYYQHLAREIKTKSGGHPVDIIGFSIGAHVALELSALLGDSVRHIHLVSAAAPLNGGDFINDMAGGLVFKLAMKKPFIFTLLTQYQRLMARLAPRMLVSMLFASAMGKDKELSRQADFKRYITSVIRSCFQHQAKGYIRDINFYVTWPGKLNGVISGVSLWHGTSDNWSPFDMASYLCRELPGATQVEAMEGLSHYSTLYEAAPKICEHLSTVT